MGEHDHVAVIGAGSWGTALAKLISETAPHPVRVWARNPDVARQMHEQHENLAYLPGFKLTSRVSVTTDLDDALWGARMVFVVVPSHGLRELLQRAAPSLPADVPVVSATKGIENSTLMLMSEVFADVVPDLGDRLCVLSGPSFAREVAAGAPAAVSVAGHGSRHAETVQALLMSDRFRVYTTDDVVGVEVGAALKNVIAIAAGASDGLGFGHNARAALITRGVAEIARLGQHLGGNPLTLAGLSGVGDLVLTCTGDLSRNRRVGQELGRGRSLDDVLGGMNMVAEGVRTAKSAYELARRHGVDMPITTEVFRVLYEGKAPLEAVDSLMLRAPRPERDV